MWAGLCVRRVTIAAPHLSRDLDVDVHCGTLARFNPNPAVVPVRGLYFSLEEMSEQQIYGYENDCKPDENRYEFKNVLCVWLFLLFMVIHLFASIARH